MTYINSFLTKISLKFIRLYQATLSPDKGWFKAFYPHGYCQFHPHCSEYGYQAIAKYGWFRGWFKAIYRIIRCNPLSKGGLDPLK